MIPMLGDKERVAAETAAATATEREQKKAAGAAKQEEKVREACQKLCSGRAGGDASKLAIGDLVTLITWKGGKEKVPTRPKDTAAEAWKDTLTQVWRELAVPEEVLHALAGTAAAAPAKPTTQSRQPAAKKQKGNKKASADSSDEENSDSDDEDDEESDDEEEEEDSAEDEDEETWEVKAIHGKRGSGKKLQYDVEWETGERTWEPTACLTNNIVLEEWLAAQKS